MTKMIIDNRSSASDTDALRCVIEVIYQGKIQNNGSPYCCLTTFNDYMVMIHSSVNKKSDRFVVTDLIV